MADAGRTPKDIDQQKKKKRSGENPKENTQGFCFYKESSHEKTGNHQPEDDTPSGPASRSPGNDGLDIGKVEAFVVFGETIAIHGENMVIAQVERASGEWKADEASPSGAPAWELPISVSCPIVHSCIHRRETR
jgi:hypothetical protein